MWVLLTAHLWREGLDSRWRVHSQELYHHHCTGWSPCALELELVFWSSCVAGWMRWALVHCDREAMEFGLSTVVQHAGSIVLMGTVQR